MEENNNKQNSFGEYVFCHECGTKNIKANSCCINCGTKLYDLGNLEDVVKCPNCGSQNIGFVTYQASSNFDKDDACCGYLLCGPIGLLNGVKDKTDAKTVRKCKYCGHEF